MPHQTFVESVQAVVARVAHHIDARAWADLRALYADRVTIDYRSLFGGEVQERDGGALIDGWRTVLAGVSTQHLLGPIDVADDGERATARCHVRAWHCASGLPGGDEWVVAGHYVFGLRRAGGRWIIDAMRLDTFHQSGNRNLLAEASAVRSPTTTA
jgi:SnoaL-like protein